MTTPHLDDELLSAHLDGEPVDGPAFDVAEHLADCPDCRARLGALRRVVAAVGTAVPPPSDEQRQAAVAAALAARVPSLEARRRRLTVLAAAAAVVAVFGSLALLRSGDGGGGGDSTTAALDTAERGPTFEGGDLGDQSDPTELALRLQAVVEPQAVGGSAVSGATADSAQSEPKALSRSPAGQVAPTKERITSADPDCLATAAKEYGTGLGPLAYRASLRWQGTPAVVLVYPVEGASGPLDHRVLVMARGDCRLLVAQTI